MLRNTKSPRHKINSGNRKNNTKPYKVSSAKQINDAHNYRFKRAGK